jgi:site-specific DNA-cytosine methylase
MVTRRGEAPVESRVLRPYYRIPQNQDRVHVIGHHNQDVDFDPGKMEGQVLPHGPHKPALRAQDHAILVNGPEDTSAAMRADSDKVRARGGVVVTAETDAPAYGKRQHGCPPLPAVGPKHAVSHPVRAAKPGGTNGALPLRGHFEGFGARSK